MGWFRSGPKSFLEPELEEWHLAAWTWLIRNLGGIDGIAAFPLVLPNRVFFPPTDATGAARVRHVFEQVKKLAGLEACECDLLEQPRGPELRVGEVATLTREGSVPAGTFGLEGNRPAITYDPALENEPVKLVAVLAHELAHLRLKAFPEDLPGDRDANERATDLATVATGFGLFGADSAFNFQRHQDAFSQGWRSSRLGYLSEREWAFALAVRFRLLGEDIGAARPYLKSHLFTDLKTASSCLKSRDIRGELCSG